MSKRRKGSTLPAALMATGLITILAGTSHAQAASAETKSVPVVGTFSYVVPERGTVMAGAIHQVTRVQGGTLVVWSLGPKGKDAEMIRTIRIGGDFNDGVSSVGPYLAKLADPASKTVLKPLALGNKCLCSDFTARQGNTFKAGELSVIYAVFPEVPASTSTVDLDLSGFGNFVPGVPISKDKPLTPTAKDAVPVLGTGWPAFPAEADIAKAIAEDEPKAVWDMSLRTGRADNSARVDDGKSQTTVDLASDVLFAFDSADLTGQANAGLALAADKVKAGKATAVTVTGYTDSTGADDYNLALSQRRAESVKAALTPLLPGVSITASGKGEADPVATNDNAEGQALNRRVSIVFEAGK